jgi:hypothetical protein
MILPTCKFGRRLTDLPPDAVYMAKPWRALDVLMVAGQARVSVG